MSNEIKNPELWESGARKIEWVKRNMPLLNGAQVELNVERKGATLTMQTNEQSEL